MTVQGQKGHDVLEGKQNFAMCSLQKSKVTQHISNLVGIKELTSHQI